VGTAATAPGEEKHSEKQPGSQGLVHAANLAKCRMRVDGKRAE
jgi:hypothetical protein